MDRFMAEVDRFRRVIVVGPSSPALAREDVRRYYRFVEQYGQGHLSEPRFIAQVMDIIEANYQADPVSFDRGGRYVVVWEQVWAVLEQQKMLNQNSSAGMLLLEITPVSD